MRRYLPLLLIGGVFIAVIVGTMIMYRSRPAETTTPFANQGTVTPAITPSVAAPSATPENKVPEIPASIAVTVEEYGDYQCPPCGVLHPEMKKIEHEYGPRINFVFHNLPLTQIHKNALFAAQAAEAARLQSRFWEMHDRLYETQNAWKDEQNPRPIFLTYAKELGLDTERFTRDMDGSEVQLRLKEDKEQADLHGISGTPTVLIDGKELKYEATSGEGIRKGIEEMLSRKAAGK